MRDEIKNNQELFATTLNVHPTDTALFVNGMFFDMDIVDIMTLLQVLRQELTTMEGLHNLGKLYAISLYIFFISALVYYCFDYFKVYRMKECQL